MKCGLFVWTGEGRGYHDSRRHASAMLRIAAVLSSLNCILRRNDLAKDRRAQNALLVSWYPASLCPYKKRRITRRFLFICVCHIFNFSLSHHVTAFIADGIHTGAYGQYRGTVCGNNSGAGVIILHDIL